MDDNLKAFLEKFAEFERRVRKLAAEDRALRDDVQSLRERLNSSEAETSVLRDLLDREKLARKSARDKVAELIGRLENLKQGPEPAPEEVELVEVAEGER